MTGPSTTDDAYVEHLAAAVDRRGWRAVLDPQLPYRWNIRRLGLGRVLDVGCGAGRNLGHLRGDGVGVDHNPGAVAVCRRRGLTAYTTDEFPASPAARPGSFDSLLVAHVLEHLTPEGAAELLGRYLPYVRSGGTVVAICPQERGQRADPTHVTHLPPARLVPLLASCGVRVERTRSFPFPRWAGRWFTHNETIAIGRWPAGG